MNRNHSWTTQRRSAGRMMKHLHATVLILALVLLLPALAQATDAGQQSGAPDMAAIDRYVASQLDTIGIPGASLAIVHGDQVAHLQGFGRADSQGRAMTPQTPALIGSLTKSFTAVAIMQLVERGAVELDAPVQRYLPWFQVSDPDASAQITVRHLLTHTSGLSGRGETDLMRDEDTRADAIERQVRALAAVELTQPVGSAWQYASMNYSILGLIIEAVSGQSYEAYVGQHILAPLGMRHSFASPALASGADMAEGHQYWFGQARPSRLPFARGLLPSGYLVSSAEDMSRYLIAHLNGGRSGDAQILSPAGVAELHRPGFAIDADLGAGMGWGVARIDGVQMLQHSGNTNNFRSEMWLLPEAGWGVVLLMNASDQLQNGATLAIGQGIVAMLQGQAPQAVTLNPMSRTLYGAILGISGLEMLGIARGIRTLRRWRAAAPAPSYWRHVVLPLVGHLMAALIFLVLVPALLLGGSLWAAVFLVPDLGYTLAIVGTLALGWGLLRTLLALRMMHPSATHAPLATQAVPR
jgi:CubicO group peptidase (beta-lactamase class C family)